MVRIERLSFRTLEQAKCLLNRVFPDQFWWERSDIALPVSLYKDAVDRPMGRLLSKTILLAAGITDVTYWAALDGDAVVGISGYYSRRRDPPDAGWAAWSCVAPEYRRGLPRVGGALIRTVAREAARNGKRVVRLYTVSTDPAMINFLTRRGFQSTHRVGHLPSREDVRYLEGDLRVLVGADPPASMSCRSRIRPLQGAPAGGG